MGVVVMFHLATVGVKELLDKGVEGLGISKSLNFEQDAIDSKLSEMLLKIFDEVIVERKFPKLNIISQSN